MLCAVLVMAPARALGGGFAIDEQSPAGTAMAGALTAVAGDASAIFYNPAGLALQTAGGGLLIGGSLALGATRATAPDGTVTGAKPARLALPTAYFAMHARPWLVAGVGLFTHFGGGAEFGAGTRGDMEAPFPGRFIATSTQLRTVTINPTLALRVHEQVAMGAGVDVVLGSLELRRALLLGDAEGGAHLGGTAHAVGWNVGVQAQLIPGRLAAGLAYRSGFDLAFDLKAHFDLPVELAGAPADQPAATTLAMPHNLSIGVAVHPGRAILLTAEARVALWSDFHELRVSFAGQGGAGAPPPLVTPQGWRDAASARLGCEWLPVSGLALRVGLGYDQSPVPAATLGPAVPQSDRWLLGMGAGYTLEVTAARGLGLAIGYLAGLSSTRTSSNPELRGAAWSQRTHVITAAISYRWKSR